MNKKKSISSQTYESTFYYGAARNLHTRHVYHFTTNENLYRFWLLFSTFIDLAICNTKRVLPVLYSMTMESLIDIAMRV